MITMLHGAAGNWSILCKALYLFYITCLYSCPVVKHCVFMCYMKCELLCFNVLREVVKCYVFMCYMKL